MFNKIALGLITVMVAAMAYTYITSRYDIKPKSENQQKLVPSKMYKTSEGTTIEVIDGIDEYRVIVSGDGAMWVYPKKFEFGE
jgi:flagellar basal body-associated protein FliL